MILDAVDIDWLTLTTYDAEASDRMLAYFQEEASQAEIIHGDNFKGVQYDAKKLQYRGMSISSPGHGSLFIGSGMQRQKKHHMLMASGGYGSACMVSLKDVIQFGPARCTRIDLQVTVDEIEGWDQTQLFTRTKERGKTAGYVESAGGTGPLATVYIGSRQSDSFIRVYQKESGELRFLRFEVEFKGNKAGVVAGRIARGTATPSAILKYEILHCKDKKLIDCFLPAVSDATAQRIRYVKESSLEKREKWIRKQVIPALFSWANEPAADTALKLEILRAIGEQDEHIGEA